MAFQNLIDTKTVAIWILETIFLGMIDSGNYNFVYGALRQFLKELTCSTVPQWCFSLAYGINRT